MYTPHTQRGRVSNMAHGQVTPLNRLRATVKAVNQFNVLHRSYGNKPWKDKATRDEDQRERSPVYGKSLFLQMLLYYNICYSICFAAIAWVAYFWKVGVLDVEWKHQMWYGVVMGLWTSFETSRLLFGYIGNIGSRVEHLIGFCVFSILNLALVIVFYVVDKGLPRYAHDRALSTLHVMFIIPELCASFIEAKRQIRYHTVRFYLSVGDDQGSSLSP
ncbi:hypothetical protein DIPPA_52572 [Diplonema papillatum]|nr:hypothetical protein DIPPA_52572 [Diplonema papillatum]